LGTGSWVPILHNVAGAEAYLGAKFHLDPSNRLATIHQRLRQRIRGFTTMRYINLRFTYLLTYRQPGETDNDLIAQGEPFYKRKMFAKNGSRDHDHALYGVFVIHRLVYLL